MLNSPKTASTSLVLNRFQPLQLARPLEVFGSTFQVHISSGFNFSIETIYQVLVGMSVLQFVRPRSPFYYQLVNKFMYSARGTHKPSDGTKKLIRQEFEKFLDPIEIASLFNDQDKIPLQTKQATPESEWGNFLKVLKLNPTGNDQIFDLISRLVFNDEKFFEFQRKSAVNMYEATSQITTIFSSCVLAWKDLNPLLNVRVLVLVEIALQTLVQWECKINPPSAKKSVLKSQLAPLLEDKRRPLGHWFREVLIKSKCANLAEMSASLDKRGARHNNRNIGHGLLRKWSSSKHLMSHTAVKPTLSCVSIEKDRKLLEDRHYLARLMTFLCDFTRAGTYGEAPTWACVQNQIKVRHSQLHQLEVSRLLLA